MTMVYGGPVAYDAGLHPVAGLEENPSLLTTWFLMDPEKK